MRTVTIYSRHPSHKPLRRVIPAPKGYAPVVRFGSLTESDKKIQINTVEAIKKSMNKRLMKEAFTNNNVITPFWFNIPDYLKLEKQFFPCVVKNIWGSRGTGNFLIKNIDEFNRLLQNRNPENYIVEKFVNYSREYRFHVSTEGVFLIWRKLRREDTPQQDRWFFNNQTCNWVNEEHPLFNLDTKTRENISQEAVKALNSVGLDFGACDIKVSADGQRFTIIEINSAPSLGKIGVDAYISEINKLINKKLR